MILTARVTFTGICRKTNKIPLSLSPHLLPVKDEILQSSGGGALIKPRAENEPLLEEAHVSVDKDGHLVSSCDPDLSDAEVNGVYRERVRLSVWVHESPPCLTKFVCPLMLKVNEKRHHA